MPPLANIGLESRHAHSICDHRRYQLPRPHEQGNLRNTKLKSGILDAVTTSSCRRVRLTINTLTKLVSQTAEDLDPRGCEILGSDERLDPIGGVRVATLIAPFTAQQGYQQRMRDMVRSVSGPLLHDLSARDSQR